MKYHSIASDCRASVAQHKLHTSRDWMQFAVQNIVVDRTSETRRLQPPNPIPECYAKIYRYPMLKDRLRILLRGGLLGRSRAATEFKNLRRLHARGLAPQVLAFGSTRRCGLLYESLLVVEAVQNAVPLDQFIAGPFAGLSREQRIGFLSALAGFTRRMNAGRFVNGEYHWRNILVRHDGTAHRFQVIDPSASRLRCRLFHPLFDLTTLDVCAPFFFSQPERLRFFKHYAGTENQPLTARQKRQLRRLLALRRRIAKEELKRYRAICA